MIIFKEGNLLEAHAEALVNTVNTVGVMGKGIALQFKHAFPENYRSYKEAIERKEIELGKVHTTPVNGMNGIKYIINFPTKNHWRYPSRTEWIKEGLISLYKEITRLKINSIALPPLGCGNGGLDWKEVKPLIVDALKDLPIEIQIYEPSIKIKDILKKEETPKASKLTPARAMLLYLLYQYRSLGEFASEFAAEKLCYFLQRFGETQLKLEYKKAVYGPYSGKVRHVLYAMNGYYINGYEQKEAKPFETLELVPSRKEEVMEFLSKEISTDQSVRLERVSRLIQGFESPYGLELLATVDFLREQNQLFEVSEIFAALKEWSYRKGNLFSEEHVKMALTHIDYFMNESSTVDPDVVFKTRSLICDAITKKRQIQFVYNEKLRVVQPQCCGISTAGKIVLRAHLIKGGNRPEQLFELSKIKLLILLDEHFTEPGPNYNRNDSAMTDIFCQL
jgi:O-acetyl-ADP-ribose deacetylase (regulator of RNase III)